MSRTGRRKRPRLVSRTLYPSTGVTVARFKPSGFSKRRRVTYAQKGFVRSGGFYGRFQPAGGELKYFDTSKANTVASTSGTILSNTLNLVQAGSLANERIGRKIVIKKIHMRGFVFLDEALAEANLNRSSERIRIIVYLDRQANGAAATAAQIIAPTASINSFNNLENKDRFTILMDKSFDLLPQLSTQVGATPTFAVGEYMQSWQWHKRCNIPIEFGSTDPTTIADIKSNNIGVLAFSNDGVGSCGYICRIRYADN